MLRLKMNMKLGFAGKETEARCFGLKFNKHFHVWYMSSNCLCITHGIKSHSSSPPMIIICLVLRYIYSK